MAQFFTGDKPPNMNYANMIEEKSLKKGFIIATLLSTVIGTFTASMALHDKVSEKRAKKKQAKLDQGQNEEIKQMKEKLDKMSGGGGGDKDKKEEGKAEGKDEKPNDDKPKEETKGKPRSRSRSRSSSRRRPRSGKSNLDDADAAFAHNAIRSKDMIEQTYQDGLARLGPKYARGDLITENMLQAQVIQLQQTVIGVMQDALYNGRSLSEEDERRLIAAQNAARDGSIEALQGQYERMLAMEKKSNGSAPAASPIGRAIPMLAPPPNPRETLADYGVPPPRRFASPQGSPPGARDFVPEAALAVGAMGAAAGFSGAVRGGSGSRHGSPPARSTRTELPQLRKDSGYAGPAQYRDYEDYGPPPRAPKTEAGGGAKSNKTQIGENLDSPFPDERPKSTFGERPKSMMGDRPKSTMGERPRSMMGDASKSMKGEPPKSTKADLNGPSKGTQQDDQADSTKTQLKGPSKGASQNDNAKSTKGDAHTKTEAPKSRAGPPSGKDPSAEGMPPKEWYPPRKPRSQDAVPPKSRAPPTLPFPPKARSASPIKHHHKPKALPAAPAGDLFCRYSVDLQDSTMPLHKAFNSTGIHRCPSCKVLVPVDTRDVWVISTHEQSSPKSKRPRSVDQHQQDYRMDARFVVKCHTAAGQDGGFACVLCDKYRDLDCICKSVDALVKHVGSAHGPEEYERDSDLHRMKRGSNVEVNGREFVLA